MCFHCSINPLINADNPIAEISIPGGKRKRRDISPIDHEMKCCLTRNCLKPSHRPSSYDDPVRGCCCVQNPKGRDSANDIDDDDDDDDEDNNGVEFAAAIAAEDDDDDDDVPVIEMPERFCDDDEDAFC